MLLYVTLAFVVVLLFFTSSQRAIREPDTRTARDFYDKTKAAIDRARERSHGGSVRQKPIPKYDDGEDDMVANAMAERLKLAEQKAKDSANAKAPNKPDAPEVVVGVGSSAGGQTKPKDGDKEEDGKDPKEDLEVKAELNSILKKSPIIIFSKTFCPYSKKAKRILLEKYRIQPAPYVVELDVHPLGSKIQDRLGIMTNRRTVPNILIAGISIGGGDDIEALDRERKLADKIKELGGKRVEVKDTSAAA